MIRKSYLKKQTRQDMVNELCKILDIDKSYLAYGDRFTTKFVYILLKKVKELKNE